jgi:hypothetical protein
MFRTKCDINGNTICCWWDVCMGYKPIHYEYNNGITNKYNELLGDV